MKLNPRERIMLITLAILAVLAVSYFILLKPQLDKIDNLKIEKMTVEDEIKAIDLELSSGNDLDKQMEDLSLQIQEMTKVFYPEILKDKIIITLDELVVSSKVDNTSTTYGKTAVEDIKLISTSGTEAINYLKDLVRQYRVIRPVEGQPEEAPVDTVIPNSEITPEMKRLEAISTKLTLKGTYEELVNFIKGIEALERTIIIPNLVIISNDEDDQLIANMEIIFYALPKIYEQDEEYYEWTYDNKYGKEDPF